MLKMVKVKKKMRMDELIKHIFENDSGEKTYRSEDGHRFLSVDTKGIIRFSFGVDSTDTFTVEVEEEIDYDTVFEEVYRVTKEGGVTSDKNKSIGECLDWKDYQVQIFAMLDGKLQLIWEAKD